MRMPTYHPSPFLATNSELRCGPGAVAPARKTSRRTLDGIGDLLTAIPARPGVQLPKASGCGTQPLAELP